MYVYPYTPEYKSFSNLSHILQTHTHTHTHTHILFLTLAKCVSQGENITHHSQFHLLLYSILCLQLNGPIHWGNRGHLGSCLFQTL